MLVVNQSNGEEKTDTSHLLVYSPKFCNQTKKWWTKMDISVSILSFFFFFLGIFFLSSVLQYLWFDSYRKMCVYKNILHYIVTTYFSFVLWWISLNWNIPETTQHVGYSFLLLKGHKLYFRDFWQIGNVIQQQWLQIWTELEMVSLCINVLLLIH